MRGLIAKKLGMTQVFEDGGLVIPVTIIEACLLYTSDAADE